MPPPVITLNTHASSSGYKESTQKYPTIRERFDAHRFADCREKVIDLLGRLATVSVKTQRIMEEMKKAPR